MDYDEWYLLYVGILVFCELMLLFTSYNFYHNIPALIITYGVMIITGLTMFHALGSVQDYISSGTDDKNI